jgi:rod shape determining protein RodA
MIKKNFFKQDSIFNDLFGIIIITIILLSIGLIGIWDITSISQGFVNHTFVKRQLIYFFSGLITFFVVIKMRNRIEQFSGLLFLVSIFLFFLPLIPGFWNTNTPYGTVNHIRILGSQICVDYWIILLILPFLANKIQQIYLKNNKYLSMIYLCLGLMTVNFFLICRSDVAMLLLFDSIAILMLMCSPLTKKEKLIISFFIIGLPLLHAINLFYYQLTSTQFYINDFYFKPWWDELHMAIKLFASSDVEAGGFWGLGFGSYQVTQRLLIKWQTLEHYILQVTVKQFGLVGLFCVINLYLLIAFNRIKNIVSSQDGFERCLKIGALSFIVLQALSNILKTTNVFSFAGAYIPPFIGFGVDGMTSNFFCLGLLFWSTSKKAKSKIISLV